MQVRKPAYDYSHSCALWCKRNPWFSQQQNLASLMIPYLERYLNLTMRRAQAKLGPQHQALKDQISWFCKQEANHYAQHEACNQALDREGYPHLADYERVFEAHYERLLTKRSHKFNCAYALGFETLGPIAAEFWFENLDDMLEGSDPITVAMWKWHLAEEYEHRNVVYDVYQTLYGGYICRIYGLISFIRHLRAWNRTMLKSLLDVDRAKMAPGHVTDFNRRHADFRKRESRFSLPRLIRAFSPFYTPRKYRQPKGLTEFLNSVVEAA